MSQVTASNPASTAIARRAAKTGPGQGDAYWFYGDLVVVRSPEGALPIITEHHVSPGASAPLHVHDDVDDSFYLLSGRLALRCGDDALVAAAGDYVSLPEGVPHT
ncbi:MAG TPA: cupin domain-containing protein, partial [Candidatus Binatia bacterium]|nr:cupin domain-containing protein [Candidatus Binatia bacterium]